MNVTKYGRKIKQTKKELCGHKDNARRNRKLLTQENEGFKIIKKSLYIKDHLQNKR